MLDSLLPLGDEEVVAADPNSGLVSPVWRRDGGEILFMKSNSWVHQYPQAAPGSIYKQTLPLKSTFPFLVFSAQKGNPATYARFSPAPVVIPGIGGGDAEWMISWGEVSNPEGNRILFREEDDQQGMGYLVSARDATNVQYPEWSPVGADQDDPDRMWIVHEQDDFEGSRGFDDIVKSEVTAKGDPLQVLISSAEGSFVGQESPRFSPRSEPGYSGGYAIFFPGPAGSKYIAGRLAFPSRERKALPSRAIIAPEAGKSFGQGEFSPDGKWIAFREGIGRFGVEGLIYVAPFPADPEKDVSQLPIPRGQWQLVSAKRNGLLDHRVPVWNSESRWVVYEKYVNRHWGIYGRRVVPKVRYDWPEVCISQRSDLDYYSPAVCPVRPSCCVAYQRSINGRYQIVRRGLRRCS